MDQIKKFYANFNNLDTAFVCVEDAKNVIFNLEKKCERDKMFEIKQNINHLKNDCDTSKKEIRDLIYKKEKELRKLCTFHCGIILYLDEDGFPIYSHLDEKYNCTYCGLHLNF